MNIVAKLLSIDPNLSTLRTEEMTMPLFKLGGEEFTFHLQGLNAEDATEAQDKMFTTEAGSGIMELDTFKVKGIGLSRGCPSIFTQELRQHFDCISNEALVNRLFTHDELSKLYDKIMELSESVELPSPKALDGEVKNS